MSPRARPLLALAAAALLHAACAYPRQASDPQCTTICHGECSGDGPHTAQTVIDKGTQQAYVDVQNPWCSVVRGQQVTVCDDVAPSLLLPSLPQYTPVGATRNGDYHSQQASFSVTLWC